MPEPPPEQLLNAKTREAKILGYVIGALVCLLAGVTVFVMRTNQTLGTTQLRYATLQTAQLKNLDERLGQLTVALAKATEFQDNFSALIAQHLQRLQTE